MSDQLERYWELPMEELSLSTFGTLSMHLNPLNDLPYQGRFTDWRGVAELRGFRPICIRNFARKDDPTGAVLEAWNSDNLGERGRTVRTLIVILQRLERRDVLDALRPGLEDSWDTWRLFTEHVRHVADGPEQDPQVSSASDAPAWRPGYEAIVSGDRPGKLRTFDAMLCYAEEDGPLAWRWTRHLESHNLRIMYVDRDLLAGGDHCTILAQTIKARCKVLVFLATHSAMNSPICDFMVKFAHYMSPGSSRGKSLIMVKFFNDINIQEVLQPMYHMDYCSPHKRQWFWKNLVESIRAAPPRIPLRELPGDLSFTITRQNSHISTIVENPELPPDDMPEVPSHQPGATCQSAMASRQAVMMTDPDFEMAATPPLYPVGALNAMHQSSYEADLSLHHQMTSEKHMTSQTPYTTSRQQEMTPQRHIAPREHVVMSDPLSMSRDVPPRRQDVTSRLDSIHATAGSSLSDTALLDRLPEVPSHNLHDMPLFRGALPLAAEALPQFADGSGVVDPMMLTISNRFRRDDSSMAGSAGNTAWYRELEDLTEQRDVRDNRDRGWGLFEPEPDYT